MSAPEAAASVPRRAHRLARATFSLVATSAALSGDALAQSVQTVVRGAVYDSLNQRPLADAMVQLVRANAPSISRTVNTGADGRFELRGVETGRYVIGFLHPLLDSLGITPPLAGVTVVDSTPIRVTLAVPSARTIARVTCGTDSAGTWLGRIRSAATGSPIRGARVLAQWTTFVASGNTISQRTPTVTGQAQEEGLFVLCELPLDEVVRAQASLGTDSSGVLSFTVPDSRLFRRDVYMGPSAVARRLLPMDTVGAVTMSVDVRVGTGRLRGQVRRRNGAPLEGARVTFLQNGTQATSNANGFFALDSLPLGTYTLDVRALGFLPSVATVDVIASEVASTEVIMDSRAAYLDTVKVTTQRLFDPSHERFLRNKRRGFGYFLDEDAIERRRPLYVADLLRATPGVTVVPGGFGGTVMMRATGIRTYCSPSLFLDGIRVGRESDQGIDALVNVEDVRGIEVYTRQGSMPIEYQTLDGCGSIVLWTGPRRKPLPP